jgi:Fe-S cluster biogenesis protein NfuA
MAEPQNLRVIGDRIEQLLDELQAAATPAVYDKAEDLLRLVTELYAAGLGRVVEVVSETPAVLARLVDDELVASLLVVHGLHPDSLRGRVERALDSVRPFLAQHGGDVELIDIDPDVGAVLLRLLGSCDGCPSSTVTLQHAVERAITEAAPEIVTIDVEELPTAVPSVSVTLGPKPVYDHCPSEVTV